MIKDVEREGLHVTIWHKNGCYGAGESAAKDSAANLGIRESLRDAGGLEMASNWPVYGHNSHACIRELMSKAGEEVDFLVHGFDLSMRCAAARVEILGDALHSCMSCVAASQQDRFHVTLWTAPGVKAREAGGLKGLVEGGGCAVHVAADPVVRLKGNVSLFY